MNSVPKIMNRQHLNGWPLMWQANILTTKPPKKLPQECIPVGWVLPAHWPYLIVSPMHVPLPCMPLPCMPPAMHAPCHACPAPPCHTCPSHACRLPCTPPGLYAPNHAWPPCHACPLPYRLPHHVYPPAMHAPLPGMPLHGQNSWHTLLKILPCPNFVAGGKNNKLAPSTLGLALLVWKILDPSLMIYKSFHATIFFTTTQKKITSPSLSFSNRTFLHQCVQALRYRCRLDRQRRSSCLKCHRILHLETFNVISNVRR